MFEKDVHTYCTVCIPFMFSIKDIIDNLNMVLVFDFTSFSHHFKRSCVLSFCTSFDSQSDQWEEGREQEREGEKSAKD